MRKVFFTLIFPLVAAAAIRAQSVPSTLNYQGRLTDNTPQQNPVSATVPMQFAIYDDPAAGSRLWREPDVDGGSTPVAVTGGIFNILLGGNGVPVPATLFAGGTQRWLEITANGETLTPRQAISATGYANQAQNAASATTANTAASAATATNSLQLGGVAAANYQRALATASCPANQFYSAIGAGGAAICAAPPANNLNPPVSLAASAGSPILSASNTGAGAGLFGKAAAGYAAGVYGENTSGLAGSSGVYGYASGTGTGVWGFNDTGTGIYGQSASGTGVAGYSVTGAAVTGYNVGNSGSAGSFSITAAGNPVAALTASTAGTGSAGTFSITNPASGSVTLVAANNGTGRAAHFQTGNPANTGAALSVYSQKGIALQAGIGAGAIAGIDVLGDSGLTAKLQTWRRFDGMQLAELDAAGNLTLFSGKFSGDGSGLANLPGENLTPPVTLSAASAGPVLSATNTGAGYAAQLSVNNGAGFQHALFASNNGGGDAVAGAAYGSGAGVSGFAPNATGSGGRFSVSNAANPAFALYADTGGTGGTAYFSSSNGANGSGVLTLNHAGSGDLLYATNAGGLKFRVDNGGVATAGGYVTAPSGAEFYPDQGGSLELGGANNAASANGVSPYVDFHYGNTLAQDYNVRLINDQDGRLSLQGRLNVSGTITSPRWNVSTPVAYGQGTLPRSGSFSCGGGVLLITASATGYSTSVGATLRVDVKVDGVTRGTMAVISNEASSHKALAPITITLSGITAGSHTLALQAQAGTLTDNDYSQAVVTELPF